MINDLDSYGSALLFADETALVATMGGDPVEAACHTEHHFSLCKTWFLANKLKINKGNTQRLSCTLNRTNSSKNLPVKLQGFVIDPKLSWENHIRAVEVKLSRIIRDTSSANSGPTTEQFLLTVYYCILPLPQSPGIWYTVRNGCIICFLYVTQCIY